MLRTLGDDSLAARCLSYELSGVAILCCAHMSYILDPTSCQLYAGIPQIFFSGSTKFNPPLFVLEFYGACARNIEWQMPELSINRYYYIVYTQHSPYCTSDLPTFRPNAVSDPCQLFIFVLFEGLGVKTISGPSAAAMTCSGGRALRPQVHIAAVKPHASRSEV